MKALLLIDIQNDFIPGGALAVPEGDQIIPIANKLQEKFDLVVATQDWHPSNHKSFASQHPGHVTFDVVDLNGLEQVLWPDHCVQATGGADFSPELEVQKIEAIFRKGTNPAIDSYSGFYDNGHLKATGLADYLRGKQVTELYLAGLAGDYCVYFSAKDAISEGFKTYLVEDATLPINHEQFAAAKEDIRNRGGNIVKSTAIF
ncbi:bifunctional nicotinamidase/pyrazinamidase [Pontibacter sp. SGAir0037]|uniref:bifunctional nicotinamidase/pyrazinamidase n=1 Tax=Pontibacter sp. SGAir0037 TaxID=2571030 RepID=UPI0010CD0A84|nr:bifunctional nicotinamidase/pyrazinamidase [Pontibacter sp. SGAir0037]QCR21959.1 bifunctional nicotinamidase/pyrazinamidase [Pontibacter sp. SGAir0037]